MRQVTSAFNVYWFVALACAGVVLFIVIQYFRGFIAFVSGVYKRRASRKRAVERLSNLKREEPQPAAASVEADPILERAEPPQPEPAISEDLPQQASIEDKPIHEHAELSKPELTVSGYVYAAPKDYDRAMWLDTKFAVTYEIRNLTAAAADSALTAIEAVHPRNSGRHVKLDLLADASEKSEVVLTPKAPEPRAEAKEARASKGGIGVTIRRLTDGAALAFNVKPARGALVTGIDENSPAEAAGIGVNDVIVKIDGKDVKEAHDLPRIVADLPVGKNVAVTIIRTGKELTKTLKVGWLEDADEQDSFDSYKGEASEERKVAADMTPEATANAVQKRQSSGTPRFMVPSQSPRFGKRPAAERLA